MDKSKYDNKTAWEKYYKLKDKAEKAVKKLVDFASELGYGHLADGFDEDLWEDYDIMEEVLEKNFGPDPFNDDNDDEYDDDICSD